MKEIRKGIEVNNYNELVEQYKGIYEVIDTRKKYNMKYYKRIVGDVPMKIILDKYIETTLQHVPPVAPGKRAAGGAPMDLTPPFGYTPPTMRTLLNRDISNGTNVIPIPIYCDTGSKEPPQPEDYEYIHSNIVMCEFKSHSSELLICCDCETCDPYKCPCYIASGKAHGGVSYISDGRIFADAGHEMEMMAVIMCGPKCSCNVKCLNRASNIKFPHRLEIFRRDNTLGFGVRCQTPIRFGDIVCEFAGVVEDDLHPDAVPYSWVISSHDNSELMDNLKRATAGFVDERKWKRYLEKDDKNPIYVNPYHKGNVGRFIAHGCFPNLKVMRIVENFLDPARHRIFLVCQFPVPSGMELTVDYGAVYLKTHKFECLCGTVTCAQSGWGRVPKTKREEVLKKYVYDLNYEVKVGLAEIEVVLGEMAAPDEDDFYKAFVNYRDPSCTDNDEYEFGCKMPRTRRKK